MLLEELEEVLEEVLTDVLVEHERRFVSLLA